MASNQHNDKWDYIKQEMQGGVAIEKLKQLSIAKSCRMCLLATICMSRPTLLSCLCHFVVMFSSQCQNVIQSCAIKTDKIFETTLCEVSSASAGILKFA
jgi:hypothetical protein